ncbi:SDR family NAD(P)-dependent oxidoreductase [Pontimicrobium sp. SW4]|uniref:SDR family NAD(P)-dependent oxidoreductase n=1 Tax=Pontimicrobium sp. SW4 TaxID=3153519 RepID=A0AAU7BRD2_9FLAO
MKKTVLITGASKGIGFALAKKFLEEGFYVIGTSRDGKIKDVFSKDFTVIKLDLSDVSSINIASDTILKQFKPIDILVNNAGIGPDLDMEYPELDSFNLTLNVNLTGTVFFTESIINFIKKKVINISSKMGSVSMNSNTDSVAYRISKSGINMYTKILTNRLKDKINVAAVHPGWVKTTISENSNENARLTSEESAKRIYNFINRDFDNGVYWDVETHSKISW